MRTSSPVVITDDDDARRLAALLNAHGRLRPTVVVTTPAGRTHPYIDVGDILQHVGDLADIYVLPSGALTWTFSRAMPPGTEVYGGAGRVYPVGTAWVGDVRISPLHLAFDPHEGRRATERLVSDAMTMAASAGLLARDPESSSAPPVVGGVVAGIPHAERAIVALDSRELVTVVPELVVPGVPLGRLLARGMQVRGVLDQGSRRLDLRGALRSPEDALEAYTSGAVVPAEVVEVRAASVCLRLHPQVVVDVPRTAVTSNDLDDLRSLMSPGEVLRARIVGTAPHWALRLDDIDDAEVVLDAPALLPGGPPWLVESGADGVDPLPAPLTPRQESLRPATPAVAPSPLLLDRSRRREPGLAPPASAPPAPAPPAPAPGGDPVADPVVDPVVDAADAADLVTAPDGVPEADPPKAPTQPPGPATHAVDPAPVPRSPFEPIDASPGPPRATPASVPGVGPQVARLRAQLEQVSHRLADVVDERGLLHARVRELEEELRRSGEETRRLRTENRRRGQRRQAEDRDGPAFADPERGFRYRVLTAWATRTPLAEQATRPLPDFDIGPAFLASLAHADVDQAKVADVVFEVVTGRVHELAGRDLHQLRSSRGGGTGSIRRDGALCWRAALQTNAPQARRLHYWMLPQGRIELSRVVRHDDMAP